MPSELRIAYFAHTLRSDWNNGNAHFLRGLMRSLTRLGHQVSIFEPATEWSITNLLEEEQGSRSLQQFQQSYPDLDIQTYPSNQPDDVWSAALRSFDVVILHEWNPPALSALLLRLRETCGYKLLFHDTHHRASSSPQQIELFGLAQFDGVLAFGDVLTRLYRDRFNIHNVWTLHEAADTTMFTPSPSTERENKIVWIGNWGEGERASEIRSYLLQPAAALRGIASTTIYGVRYPADGLQALQQAHVTYGGYLPNLDAPSVYARAKATVHIPRQQYSQVMVGIPTIRVFEALACGIPLVSAPWQDTEHLFRPGDFCWASTGADMERALRTLITDPAAAQDQIARGLETVLTHHTCDHRARQLAGICQEVLS